MNKPDTMHPDEWQLRVDLAACYRLVALYGWSDLVFTHISARLPESVSGHAHQFLINPYGLMFDEITASSLIKVDMQCNKLQDSPFPVNPAGFTIHSALHAARPDVQCVLHTHTRAGVAVSALKSGVLPISQQSTFVVSSLAYHDYEGVALRPDEIPRLQADMGDKNFLMLRNHGLLTVGKGIADAFLSMYTFENTCRIQVDALAGLSGAGDLTAVNPQILSGVAHAMKVQTGGIGVPFGVVAAGDPGGDGQGDRGRGDRPPHQGRPAHHRPLRQVRGVGRRHRVDRRAPRARAPAQPR